MVQRRLGPPVSFQLTYPFFGKISPICTWSTCRRLATGSNSGHVRVKYVYIRLVLTTGAPSRTTAALRSTSCRQREPQIQGFAHGILCVRDDANPLGKGPDWGVMKMRSRSSAQDWDKPRPLYKFPDSSIQGRWSSVDSIDWRPMFTQLPLLTNLGGFMHLVTRVALLNCPTVLRCSAVCPIPYLHLPVLMPHRGASASSSLFAPEFG
jgi:hypothetical protein